MNPLSITLAVEEGSCKERLHGELAAALGRCLDDMGHSAVLAEGQSEIPTLTDAVLFIGDCLAFGPHFPLLRTKHSSKPRVLLWQMEELPPPKMDPASERLGRHLAQASMHLGGLLSHIPGADALRTHLQETLARTLYPRPFHNLDQLPADERQEGAMALGLRAFNAFQRVERIEEAFRHCGLDHVFTDTCAKRDYLLQRGIPTTHCLPGWHPLIGEDAHTDRDLDVLYLGELCNCCNASSGCCLGELNQSLERNGIRFHQVASGCYGEERTALVARSRIFLVGGCHPWDYPVDRFLIGMASGALVVGINLDETAPFCAGKHFINTTHENAVQTIALHLECEQERSALTRKATGLLRNNYSMEHSAKILLEKMNPTIFTSSLDSSNL